VVITRRMARKYFGRDDPIGETLELDRRHPMRVTAVLQDLPTNTHLNLDLIASGRASFSIIAQKEADAAAYGFNSGIGGYTYFRLKPGADIKTVSAALPAYLDNLGFSIEERRKDRIEVSVLPMAAVHLSPGDENYLMKPRGNPVLNKALAAVAALLVAVAGINFVNLMTARAARRAVEIGIRKVSGAMRLQLAVQFLGESAIYVAIGLGVAAVAVAAAIPFFNAALQRTSIAFDLWRDPVLAAGFMGLGVCIAILAGLYPALVLPSFRPASVLKSGPAQKVGSPWVRPALVVLQFAVLTGLVLFTVVIYRQSSFAFASRLRLASDEVLLVRTNCLTAFKDEVGRLPGVQAAVCSSAQALNYERSAIDLHAADGKPVIVDVAAAGAGFFELYGIHPLAGRSFDRGQGIDTGDEPTAVVLNESAVRTLGFHSDQDAVGKPLDTPSDLPVTGPYHGGLYQIVGVVPDFSVDAVHQRILPELYVIHPRGYQLLNVRLSGRDIP
jgi:putative ABC transport system permease protein